MARAVHVWVVEDDEKLTEAVFTVKRECLGYLEEQTPERLADLTVQKFKDGGKLIDLWAAPDFVLVHG